MKRLTERLPLLCALALAIGGCSGGGDGEQPRYGELMTEVGRRFELMGRAAQAGRWELAAYELHEIEEIFEDLPEARPPDESRNVDLATMARTFAQAHPPALEAAIRTRSATALSAATAAAASACNQCHEASNHKFIEIPATPGAPVPRLDPVP
jgi:hypothetical protein